MQPVLLRLLPILRFVRDYIVGRAAGSWSWFIAFLGRRMSELRRSWNRKPGTSRDPRAADQLLPGNKARSYSASGGSAVLREYVVAASTVPGRLATSSASLPTRSFQEDPGQSASVPPSPTSTTSHPPSLFIHQPHTPYGSNRSASSHSIRSGWSGQSRASERLSRIVNSRELLPTISDNQPTRPPRGIYRQFGPGVEPSASRGQLSRTSVHSHPYDADEGRSPVVSPSPSSSMHGPLRQLSRTSVHSHPYDADEGRSPVVSPSPSSSIQGPLRRSGSSTSINLYIQNPSTGSLATTLTEESMTMHSAHSAPSIFAMGQSETASQHSTIASSATSEFILPEGRFVQLIHSDQIPRYYENVTM
jgi:hypothetical protein